MIAVIGSVRSGTSMVCQTLGLLGLEMAAPPFIEEHENIRQFNPKGFYELNLKSGITNDEFKGKVVKLFGWHFYMTDNSLMDKVIYITRNREDAINSYDKMRLFLPHREHTSEAIYDSDEHYIQMKLKTVNYMHVEFEAIKENPSIFVNALIVYLNLNPTDEMILHAINNID